MIQIGRPESDFRGLVATRSGRQAAVRSLRPGHLVTPGILAGHGAGIPATAQFSLSLPSLLLRVHKLGPIRPFPFLTARFLEPSPDPTEDLSELVSPVPTKEQATRALLMRLPRQRSWGSVVEAFVRHRDRKCTFDEDGRMLRRRVLVRKPKIVGLGKEASRIEAGRVPGQHAVGGRAKRYVDPNPFKGSATGVARRLGVSRRTVFNRRRWRWCESRPGSRINRLLA